MYRVIADRHTEVGGIGGSACPNLLENAFIGPLRGEYAGNAMEDRQIGVLEAVFAGHGGQTRLILVPGAELPLAVDFADGFGIGQLGTKRHRTRRSGIPNRELMDVEPERLFARFLRQGLEDRTISIYLTDNKGRNVFLGRFLAALAIMTRRYMDLQAFEAYAAHARGRPHQLEPSRVRREFRDGNQRGQIRPTLEAKNQAFSGHMKPGK